MFLVDSRLQIETKIRLLQWISCITRLQHRYRKKTSRHCVKCFCRTTRPHTVRSTHSVIGITALFGLCLTALNSVITKNSVLQIQTCNKSFNAGTIPR